MAVSGASQPCRSYIPGRSPSSDRARASMPDSGRAAGLVCGATACARPPCRAWIVMLMSVPPAEDGERAGPLLSSIADATRENALLRGPRSCSYEGSAGDAGVPQGVAPRLGPHAQTVRALADRDAGDHVPVDGREHVDLVVVPARQPQLAAVGGDPAH